MEVRSASDLPGLTDRSGCLVGVPFPSPVHCVSPMCIYCKRAAFPGGTALFLYQGLTKLSPGSHVALTF